MNVAIIPARGGSKRVPRKNIKPFAGRPLIGWPIAAARESGLFDRVIVSTDDAEIADVAASFGAEIPFIRPAELADDYTGTAGVVRHALEAIGVEPSTPGAALCLYATAAAVDPGDLRAGHALLQGDDLDFVFAARPFPHPIERALRLDAAGRVAMVDPSAYARRTQDLEPAYHDAGQFYWGRFDAWLSGAPTFGSRSRIVTLPPERAIDIDTPEDWGFAERVFRSLRGG